MLSRTARIVVAAASAATSLAACSGEQARDDFIAAADGVCREADERIADLERPLGAGRIRAYVEQAEEISADLVEDLEELEPPEGDEAEIDALIGELERATALLEPLVRASVDRDVQAIENLQDEVRQVTDDVNELAESYGFEVCGAKVVEPAR